MTSDSPRSCASKSRSTAAFMFGSRNGSARFLRRGARNFSIAGSSLKPRLSRHCASSGEILSDDASVPASSGCGGAIVQRNFIFYSTTDGHGLTRIKMDCWVFGFMDKWMVRSANQSNNPIIRLSILRLFLIRVHPGLSVVDFLFPPRGGDGQRDGDGQDRGDDQQRSGGRDFGLKPLRRVVVRVQQHFCADKNQDDGQAGLEKTEHADGAGEQKIQRAQAEDGKHVRGERSEERRVGK